MTVLRVVFPTPCRFNSFLEALRGFLDRPAQCIKTIRWVTAIQHGPEYRVGICSAVMGTQGFSVIHPCEHNHPGFALETKKQTVLLEELGTKPVFSIWTESFALSKYRASGVGGNVLGCNLDNRSKSFRADFRVASFLRFNLPNQFFTLIRKNRMRVN